MQKNVILSSEYNKVIIMDKNFTYVEKVRFFETELFDTYEQNDYFAQIKKMKKLQPDDFSQFPNLLQISNKFKILMYQDDRGAPVVKFFTSNSHISPCFI